MKISLSLFIFCLMVISFMNVEGAPADNRCEGGYQKSGNQIVVISQFDPGGGNLRLFFIDFGSGYARLLHEKNGTLFAGDALFSDTPVELQLDCSVSNLKWQIQDDKFTAGRLAITQQDVLINGGLRGTIYLPAGQPPYPALVLLHGSGKLTRYSFGPIPYFFAANGVAVLTYDKRGTGSSEGDFQAASFQDFIHDGVAAVSVLRSRSDIDAARIGIWGSSQGGFLAAGVASRANGVRLLINQSGMFVPAWKQEMYRVRSEMEANGFTQNDVKKALDYLNAFFQAGKTGNESDWQKSQALMQMLRDEEWFDFLPKVDTKEDLVSFWNKDYSYDPVPELRGVKCPVRAVFGSLDRSTPVKETIENMRKGLKHQDFESAIIENANHAFLEAVTGSEREIPQLKRFVPAAFDVQKKWLLQLLRKKQADSER